MTHSKTTAAIILVLSTVSCASSESPGAYGMSGGTTTSPRYATPKAPPMDPSRKIVEQDCTKPVKWYEGNVRCK